MKKRLLTLLGLGLLLGAGGCGTPRGYWTDRGRDAMDMFNFAVGAGAGAKGQIGPLASGILFDATQVGLRNGQWLTPTTYHNEFTAPEFQYENKLQPPPVDRDVQALLIGRDHWGGRPDAIDRGKPYEAGQTLLVAWPHPVGSRTRHPAAYYTQVEGVIGLGLNLRAGFNPGEILDFLLGWFEVDIYDDDVWGAERRRAEAAAAVPADAAEKAGAE